MKSREVAICFLVFSAAMAPVFLIIRNLAEAPGLVKKANELRGASKGQVVAELGPPFRTMTGADYQSERAEIAASFSPDPPVVQADEALLYLQGVRLVILFLREGVVVQIYSGMT